ncbi:unnamed protein product [Protopolystoma xenopodis]|uniref:Uncharacterized protein n=1 Tax=Protopolystoma xenopodis TaxID=117903 RepID=A0A448XRJ8_9PLAT|nr:unnamed protein product [Protopolystoma xenopodis]
MCFMVGNEDDLKPIHSSRVIHRHGFGYPRYAQVDSKASISETNYAFVKPLFVESLEPTMTGYFWLPRRLRKKLNCLMSPLPSCIEQMRQLT